MSALDRNVLVLRGAEYLSVGTYDGHEFWGVMRSGAGPVRATPAGAPAWLHAVREADGSLAVTRWKGPAPTAVVSERWTRAGEFGRDARPDSARVTPAPGDPSLPKFGEHVFVEVLPEPIHKVPPVYPDAARRAKVEGTVMVQALVGRDGLVKDHRVIKSIPPLDEAAVGAIRQWRFEPARAAGKPVAVWVAVPVNFKLH